MLLMFSCSKIEECLTWKCRSASVSVCLSVCVCVCVCVFVCECVCLLHTVEILDTASQCSCPERETGARQQTQGASVQKLEGEVFCFEKTPQQRLSHCKDHNDRER